MPERAASHTFPDLIPSAVLETMQKSAAGQQFLELHQSAHLKTLQETAAKRGFGCSMPLTGHVRCSNMHFCARGTDLRMGKTCSRRAVPSSWPLRHAEGRCVTKKHALLTCILAGDSAVFLGIVGRQRHQRSDPHHHRATIRHPKTGANVQQEAHSRPRHEWTKNGPGTALLAAMQFHRGITAVLSILHE